MILRLLAIIICFTGVAQAQALEGDYLYKVTTIRIETGKLKDFLEWKDQLAATDYFARSGEPQPFLMRHSQGDQWDLMAIQPMESWTSYHRKSRASKRHNAKEAHKDLLIQGAAMIAFAEDNFATGPSLDDVKAAYDGNRFFHIEMFEAAPGKAATLFEQRRMENAYLSATGQVQNMIFARAGGSDVDVFTIGFHQSLEAFAKPSGATPEEAEAAAIAAGFKDRADISFFLRSLLSGHHDTLAVKVD